jgi:hypothetical protein
MYAKKCECRIKIVVSMIRAPQASQARLTVIRNFLVPNGVEDEANAVDRVHPQHLEKGGFGQSKRNQSSSTALPYLV